MAYFVNGKMRTALKITKGFLFDCTLLCSKRGKIHGPVRKTHSSVLVANNPVQHQRTLFANFGNRSHLAVRKTHQRGCLPPKPRERAVLANKSLASCQTLHTLALNPNFCEYSHKYLSILLGMLICCASLPLSFCRGVRHCGP